jgi:hypothetical protein
MANDSSETDPEYEQVADQAGEGPGAVPGEKVADGKVDGDVTEPLGGTTSGEDDYVAVNSGGISGDRHVPTADEEIGRGAGYDPADERYPSEERGD